ncbi:hypothetical protein BDB00DRAFT_785592 [Zychaea mexicana]|uniref:uncharacterized protein n=1 Tax=Zychaea mexicana TaxID=64656 RepID=UPI0022FE3E91|nr:uncharacterized protein BDB00DRAFT_785592 [Zychaea mexicana]KAI9496512.1 hypothetical protein BDB00DRAFT_785592 [Zychaea mexicana]
MHYLCRASAHAIANWARAEYRYKSGPKIVAADGNMQLRRFAKTKDPKDVAFTDEEEVDWYWVKDNQVVQNRNAATDGCSTWQALEKGRGRTDHLDQNGAFACTCGHGLPLAITDITTPGEQFTYVLSCLKKVTEMPLYGSNIRIMYDVGCKIRINHFSIRSNAEIFMSRYQESLDCIKDVPIAVGIFHITGHAPRYQIHYRPRLKEGWGIQDGEHLERLWSFLNGFVAMTRYMSSLNRRLTLTIALDFYTQQRTANIGTILYSLADSSLLEKQKSKLMILMYG